MSSTEKCDCFIVVQYIIIIVLVRIGLLTWMGVLPLRIIIQVSTEESKVLLLKAICAGDRPL